MKADKACSPNQAHRWARRVRRELDLETFDVFLLQNSGKEVLYLELLVVPDDKRRAGVGTKAMLRFVAYADRHGLVSSGSPDGFAYGSSEARLIAFYQRFGFVENKGANADQDIVADMYRLSLQGARHD